MTLMTQRFENIIGALAFRIADEVNAVTSDQLELSGPVAAAIALIDHKPGITIDELRHGLSLSHAGTVRAVDRLASAGYVERTQASHDKRAVALQLTEKGVTASQRIFETRQNVIADLLSVLTPDEKSTFEALTEKLLKASIHDVPHAFSVCRLCHASSCLNCPVTAALSD